MFNDRQAYHLKGQTKKKKKIKIADWSVLVLVTGKNQLQKWVKSCQIDLALVYFLATQ